MITVTMHTLRAAYVRIFGTNIHELPSELRTVHLIIENGIYQAIREKDHLLTCCDLFCLIFFSTVILSSLFQLNHISS
jgi:hypothetical protein